ncbi:hypothetical protein Taro_042598 [Colocasia esculenta]|uniref:USP domain-containing protein n=1 Tax=Colocasia esculenta TaxID=4460 RepID=A0A843X2W7_COLES|nr:hypothetical protein [Colocasia esculenta]
MARHRRAHSRKRSRRRFAEVPTGAATVTGPFSVNPEIPAEDGCVDKGGNSGIGEGDGGGAGCGSGEEVGAIVDLLSFSFLSDEQIQEIPELRLPSPTPMADGAVGQEVEVVEAHPEVLALPAPPSLLEDVHAALEQAEVGPQGEELASGHNGNLSKGEEVLEILPKVENFMENQVSETARLIGVSDAGVDKGLKSICYANAVLQCLTCTKPLTIYLLRRMHSTTCSVRDWCLMCELELHVSMLRESGGPLSPSRILSNMRNIGCRMGSGTQEDAHEFLRLLVTSMQSICLEGFGGEKEVDTRLQETTLIQQIFGGRLRSKVILQFFLHLAKGNNICSLFIIRKYCYYFSVSQFANIVKCLRCHLESERYENIMDLTLEIHGWVESLEDALTQFTAPEDLDGENMYRCGRYGWNAVLIDLSCSSLLLLG